MAAGRNESVRGPASARRPGVPALLVGGVLCIGGSAAAAPAGGGSDAALIASGERLVRVLDCNVCHTPKVFTERGPQPDPSRLLSGHPADEALPAVPDGVTGPGGWGGLFNPGLTAWVGPWGVTFGSNLTPDPDTGIGDWSEQDFAEAMRGGLSLKPPMPEYSALTDEELRAMFAYLRSIPPIRNSVPAARPPSGPEGGGPPGR